MQWLNRVKTEKGCYGADNEWAGGNNGGANSSKRVRDLFGVEQSKAADYHAKDHKDELREK